MKKTRLLLLGLLIQFTAFAQSPHELNIGGFVGAEVLYSDFAYFPFAITVEYKPVKARLSLNSDLQMLFYKNNFMLTMPLYLKIILGNSFRVCPEVGGFVRTNGNYGLTTGLSLEYRIKKLFLFAKADYYMDVNKEQTPSHDGSLSSYNYTFSSVWVSLGVKWNILK